MDETGKSSSVNNEPCTLNSHTNQQMIKLGYLQYFCSKIYLKYIFMSILLKNVRPIYFIVQWVSIVWVKAKMLCKWIKLICISAESCPIHTFLSKQKDYSVLLQHFWTLHRWKSIFQKLNVVSKCRCCVSVRGFTTRLPRHAASRKFPHRTHSFPEIRWQYISKMCKKKKENVHTFFVLCFSPLLGLFSRLTMKTGRVDKARRER